MRSDRDKGVSFYRLPTVRRGRSQREQELSAERRQGFLAAISRHDLSKAKLEQVRICSRHFISGKPADLFDELHPDWLPTQNLGHSKENEKSVQIREDRYERKKTRIARMKEAHNALALNDTDSLPTCSEAFVPDRDLDSATNMDTDEMMEDRTTQCAGVQTEETVESLTIGIAQLQAELQRAYLTIRSLEDKANLFTESCMQGKSDDFIKHYTGLPNFKVLKAICDFVIPRDAGATTKLPAFQEVMIVLLKLRHNPSSQDLSYQFGVSCSTISRILLRWLTVMDARLKPLIMWPERAELRKTMPDCFRTAFGDKVAVVIDCFEVFIERPSNLLARACTWSSYKHHNTAKLLIGITPQGVVSFISDAWGGRVSDKYLTEHCGILNNLVPGDVVLADRGFDISDSVGILQAKLHIPAFTRGKSQLSALEVEETCSIANVMIHVERIIGLVRQKYTILRGTLPINFITKRVGEDSPLNDKIVRVCCGIMQCM